MNWQDYENIVFDESKRVFKDCEVIKNAHIKGRFSLRQRQIDILIRNVVIEDKATSLVIDAKFYNKKVDIKEVESFISMLKDVGIDKGILVTNIGYSKSAINRAHLGENNIEVDILNFSELQQFQGIGAIAYSGSSSAVISAPFGWVVDGTNTGVAPATLYQRGYSLEDAMTAKERMYLQFFEKDESVTDINSLIKLQNDDILTSDKNAKIEVIHGHITVRKAAITNYPTVEITAFKEFDDFILFGVLFCPDNVIERDINKLKFVLTRAIPMKFKNLTNPTKTP